MCWVAHNATQHSPTQGCALSYIAASTQRAASMDHATAQTDIAVVHHRRLAWRDRPLRLREIQRKVLRRSGAGVHSTRSIGLAVACFGSVRVGVGCGRARNPSGIHGDQAARLQPRVIVPLHHPQGVGRHVLAGHKPGRMFATAFLRTPRFQPANAQSLPLAQGVERQPDVLCNRLAFVVFDRARRMGCLLYTSPSPRDRTRSRMPSSA